MQILKEVFLTLFLLIIFTYNVNALSFDDITYAIGDLFSKLNQFFPFYEENFAIIDFIIFLTILFLPIRMILERRWQDIGVKLAFILSLTMSIGIVYSEVERDQSYIATYMPYIAPVFIAAIIIHYLHHKGVSNLKSFILVGLLAVALIAFFSEKSGFKLPQPFRAYAMWIFLGLVAFLIIKYGWRRLSKSEDERILEKRRAGTPELDVRLKKD